MISGVVIRQDEEGRYCLNDLHKAAGGEKVHQPSNWLRIDQTKALLRELTAPQIRGAEQNQSLKVINGGDDRGTYGCRELVYAYAMWISPKFSLQVIRAYDAMVRAPAVPVPVPAAAAVAVPACLSIRLPFDLPCCLTFNPGSANLFDSTGPLPYTVRMTPKHPRDAFNSAFLKGMAASVLMFSPGKPPRFRIKTPKPRRMSDLEAMREDWYKIGADLNRVIRRETGQ